MIRRMRYVSLRRRPPGGCRAIGLDYGPGLLFGRRHIDGGRLARLWRKVIVHADLAELHGLRNIGIQIIRTD